ncbi:F-box only protein 44-like isoform X2 [Lycorma delicatula]
MESVDDENGFVLSAVLIGSTKKEFYIPEEILALILSYVDLEDLIFKCRLVCHSWKRIIEDVAVRHKAERDCASKLKTAVLSNTDLKKKVILPWYLYYWICKKKIFGRNLLKNNCGQDMLNFWVILSNGGDQWVVEDVPNGADSLPQCDDFMGKTSCFATSFHSNSKAQLINLSSEGLVPKIMDEHQPVIRVSEWYAGRYDCGCVYELKVALLNQKKKPIVDFEQRERVSQWEGREWHLVQHEFSNYGPGVRYIRFYHGGMDSQFWAGHYGSKMAGGVVKLFYSPPVEYDQEDT